MVEFCALIYLKLLKNVKQLKFMCVCVKVNISVYDIVAAIKCHFSVKNS